jgi:hypothetical protein
MMSAKNRFEPYAWRFLIAGDPQVGRYLCRDCDCRPSIRETAAVAEWIAAKTQFHVMRDHPMHTDLILAGLWGGISGALPNLKTDLDSFPFRIKHSDQDFLAVKVWPQAKKSMTLHDSYYDLFDARPFPILPPADLRDHVGNGFKILATGRDPE